MSAICPLKVQKISEKQQNHILATCRKMPILRALWAITKSCKKPSEIFNSRTGHQNRALFKCSVFLYLFAALENDGGINI